MEEYKRLNRKLIHKGHIVDFYEDTMLLPDGKTAEWDFLNHRGACAMVPVTKEGNILMVRQYRNSPERYTLEIPAGGLNEGEDRMTAAARELEEETGFRAGTVHHLVDLYTTFAFCNELISVYYTEELIPSKQHLDEGESVTIESYPLEELINMILNGTIQDAKTMTALFAYRELKKRTMD